MTRGQRTSRCKRTEDGASLVEYALLLSLIVVVCIVSLAYFGDSLNGNFSRLGSTVSGTG